MTEKLKPGDLIETDEAFYALPAGTEVRYIYPSGKTGTPWVLTDRQMPDGRVATGDDTDAIVLAPSEAAVIGACGIVIVSPPPCPCHECHCTTEPGDLERLARREASVPEPPPVRTAESRDVTAALIAWAEQTDRPTVASLIRERREYGIAKYGTTLMSHNGRDCVEDARQEAGDLLQYVAQAILEGRGTDVYLAIDPMLTTIRMLLYPTQERALRALSRARE